MGLRHENDPLQIDTESGFGLAAWLDSKHSKGKNTLSLALKQGAAISTNDGVAKPISEFDSQFNYDVSDAEVIELTNNYFIDTDAWSMEWAFLYKLTDTGIDGVGGGSEIEWISTGIRPIYYLSDHLNVAFELGIDSIDDETSGVDGVLLKSTFALQLAKGRGYFSRPVLRAFITHATWSDEFEGTGVSSIEDHADKSSGWSAGFQLEAWWWTAR